MARPKRESDPDLAALVMRACKAADMSLSRMARSIGVSPSTLTRSIHGQSFSDGMRAKLEGVLLAAMAKHPRSGSSTKNLQKLLLLLSELQAMIPELREQLLEGLDPEARIGQTSERRGGNG